MLKTAGKFTINIRAPWIDISYQSGGNCYFIPPLNLDDICDLEHLVNIAIAEAIRELSKNEPQAAEFLRRHKG